MNSPESIRNYPKTNSRFNENVSNYGKKTKGRILRNAAGGTLLVASWASVLVPALDKGITIIPQRTHDINFVLSEEDREQISSVNPIKIVHRAGNSEKGIIEAHSNGANFAELDVTKFNGELYADHGQTFDNPVPLINGVVKHVGFDASSMTIRTGGPNFTVKEAFEVASKINQNQPDKGRRVGLFFDLKRGDINEEDVALIWRYSHEYYTPIMLHSGRDDLVFMARQVLGELEKNQEDKTQVLNVLGSEDELEKFVDNGGSAALIINKEIITGDTAERYRDALKETFTILYVNEPQPDSIINGVNLSVLNGFMGEGNFLNIFPE